VDYSKGYPQREAGVLGHVTYAQLKSGEIEVQGKKVPATPLSSYPRAREIAGMLKDWITAGRFELTSPTASVPRMDSGLVTAPMPYNPPADGAAWGPRSPGGER